MSKTYAYIRMSKDTFDAENQGHEITAGLVFPEGTQIHWVEETISGKTDASYRQLGTLIALLEPGDTLAVADVSRLGRRSLDVMETVARIVKKKARLVAVKSNQERKDDIGSLGHVYTQHRLRGGARATMVFDGLLGFLGVRVVNKSQSLILLT